MQTLAGLRENISSPQFKEALSSFTSVLGSEVDETAIRMQCSASGTSLRGSTT